jgi:Fe-S oxidoreductase
MWMDETIGQRVNENRTDEALELRPDLVTAACPFCIVMLTDGVNLRQQQGRAPENVEVTDVSEVLLRSVRSPETDASASATSRATSSHPEGNQP